MEKENEMLKKEIKIIVDKLRHMVQENRKNNVLIQNPEIDSDDQNTLKGIMGNFMEENFKIEVKIENTKKIRNITCLIELENTSEKTKLVKNKSNFENLRENKKEMMSTLGTFLTVI